MLVTVLHAHCVLRPAHDCDLGRSSDLCDLAPYPKLDTVPARGMQNYYVALCTSNYQQGLEHAITAVFVGLEPYTSDEWDVQPVMELHRNTSQR